MASGSELRLADIDTLLVVVRVGTVNGAARLLGVVPSQVSKALARLERHLGLRLLQRGSLGVSLTDEARRILPELADLARRARALRGPPQARRLTLVASAFLSTVVVPQLARALADLPIDCLESPPGVPTAYAALPYFDVALVAGEQRWPSSWARVKVGRVRRALFASPRHARTLKPPVAPERLRGQRFIGPIYAERGEAVPGDDGCPLPRHERIFAARTQTAQLALELAALGDCLVFAPVLAALGHVARGALVEVPVQGWSVAEPLYLLCHQERVAARSQRALLAAARALLAEQ